MRVLMLTHNMAGLGGSYQRAWSIARGLSHWGIDVTLLAGRARPGLGLIQENRSGVNVVQVPDLFPWRLRHGGLSPMDMAYRVQFARSRQHDLVHGFDHRPAVSVPALAARRQWGIPFLADWADLWGRRGIADERAGLQGRLVSWLDVATEASVHEAADGATVISTFLERQMRELGMAPERIHRLPVGSNADLIRPQLVDEMRRRYGIPGESMVLASGGFAPYDRQLLLETMKHLRALEPTALLLVVGGESRAVVRAAKKAGLAEAVRSFGVVAYEELGSLLACGDVMILPLGNRPLNAARFPNRFGDYLAAGRPIATNPTGDVGEVVKHEGVGIVAPDEPALFAEAIFDLLRDRPRRQRQGRRARELAETRYSWTALAEPLTSFVNGL